ncbi:MAG: DUF4097 family beta strand repeat-containing protein [Anaerolineae bacterium]
MSTYEELFVVGEGCSVEIDATSGDVQVEGGKGDRVTVRSSDGDVAVVRQGEALRVTSAMGGSGDMLVCVPRFCLARVHTMSGDVNLQNLDGEVSVQSASGDVYAASVAGDVQVRTVSGDIHVQGTSLTSLDLESVSGDTTIEARLEGEGRFQHRSVSGDLTLLLPADQGCTVQSHSLSGDFKCNLPHEVRQLGWGKQEAVVNGGGPQVSVRTTSGSVRIKAAEGSLERVKSRERPVRETRPLEAAAEPDEPFGLEDMPEAPAVEPAAQESMTSQRMRILKAIEDGTLSVSEGLERLTSLE